MERTRVIAPLALAQLAAWERVAMVHDVRLIRKETGQHLCCRWCDETIIPMDDNREGYTLQLGIMLAALVAHLRRSHTHVIERDGNGTEDT